MHQKCLVVITQNCGGRWKNMRLSLELQKGPPHVMQTLLSILVHLSIGMIGIGVLSNALAFFAFKLAYSFFPSLTIEQLHRTLTGIHGFPVQAVVGLLTGFILARYMRRRVMIWIWLLPLVFLCLGVLGEGNNYSSIWEHFFGSGCDVKDRCFDQMLFTLPLVASAAYSLGAALRRPVSAQQSPKTEIAPDSSR